MQSDTKPGGGRYLRLFFSYCKHYSRYKNQEKVLIIATVFIKNTIPASFPPPASLSRGPHQTAGWTAHAGSSGQVQYKPTYGSIHVDATTVGIAEAAFVNYYLQLFVNKFFKKWWKRNFFEGLCGFFIISI